MLSKRRRPVGGHAPAAGGIARAALPYLDATGAEAVQVFIGNPRGWARPAGDPAQESRFRDGCTERGVPVYVHACLLVNLGSPTEATLRQSTAALAHALERGAAIGARGVVFHAGSAVTGDYRDTALRQVRKALLPLLDTGDDLPRLLVEPSAGGGHSLAGRVDQLAAFLAAVDHPRLGICFDTCHVWAAGHDLASPGGIGATLDTLAESCGPDRLWLVHANDSRDPCGSARDRHETIGKGTIGEPAFRELMTHPATAGVPVIVETPTDGPTGHAADIATLRRLRDHG